MYLAEYSVQVWIVQAMTQLSENAIEDLRQEQVSTKLEQLQAVSVLPG